MTRRSTRTSHPGAVLRESRGAHGYTGGVTADDLSDPASVAPAVLGQAARVTALGTTANLTAIPGSFANLTAAQTAVTTLKSEAETRLDNAEAKIDAVIAALRASGLMA